MLPPIDPTPTEARRCEAFAAQPPVCVRPGGEAEGVGQVEVQVERDGWGGRVSVSLK